MCIRDRSDVCSSYNVCGQRKTGGFKQGVKHMAYSDITFLRVILGCVLLDTKRNIYKRKELNATLLYKIIKEICVAKSPKNESIYQC